jgi:hypothetical protein
MRLNHTRGASMGHVADASLAPSRDVYGNHYGGRRVKATRRDTGHWRTALVAAWEQGPKRHKFQGGSTIGLRPPARLHLEPVRPETAGGIPRGLASKPATSRPDGESWDFDENEQDFGKERNPPKPHANP